MSKQVSAETKKVKRPLKEMVQKPMDDGEELTKEFVAKEKAKLNKMAQKDPKSL